MARSARSWVWVLALLPAAVLFAVFLPSIWKTPKPGPEAPEPSEPVPAAMEEPAAQPKVLEPFAVSSDSWSKSTNSAWIAILFSPGESIKKRREAACVLAKIGSADAMSALKAALQSSPPYLKAGIAEALGESASPEAQTLLLELLKDKDEITARGAIRGLALSDKPEAAQVLGSVLFDPDEPESLRAEAALALGDINHSSALELLKQAATELSDPTLTDNVLQGLGKRPFSETEAFFREFLQTQNLPDDMKVAAVEALGQAKGDVTPFLLEQAGDPDPQVRAAAGWALSLTESESDVSPQLLSLLKQEPDPEVRVRYYQALENQSAFDSPTLLAAVKDESNPEARLAALNLLARSCHSNPDPELQNYFTQTAVPELKATALQADKPQDRLGSVIALGRADTPSSTLALQEIALQSTDPKVVQAAKAPRKGSYN